uniref:RWP-RK domain-containing protein n=2 Tax=Setaria viridis TaxID=4556 RepID=A0A4U6UAX3_SETVI|nr:hypothetical protein SEVIR_5G001200v2 [Setaria viridis]
MKKGNQTRDHHRAGRIRAAAVLLLRRRLLFDSPLQITAEQRSGGMASDAQAQQPKPTRVSLSYEEISKLFSLPIAEAASILGVGTSVLKRICRTHGIVRWPYRKLVSAKTGDDTKGPEREKAKELPELSKIAKQKASNSSASPIVSSTTSQGAAKSQQGSSKAGQVSVSPPAGNQNMSPSLAHGSQAKAIPSYMDDFKYGFPSSGLSCGTMKWWGGSSDADCAPTKDGSSEAHGEASKGMTEDDELDWGADEAETEADGAVTAEASAQLCSLRRKAVDDGRKLLNGDTRRGQEFSRLNKRQKLALAQVFGASLPDVVLLVFSE